MRTLLSLCVIAAAASSTIAQEFEPANLSQASKNYRAYRQASTEPTFGLAKVKALIKGIKPDSEENRRLPDAKFNALSFKEKFTYTMLHGEDFSQNCDMMPGFLDEEKKIFSYFPGAFDDTAMWSERQGKFLQDNRTKVIDLVRQTIHSRNRVGVNLKQAIMVMNAWELIPDVLTVYKKNPKDHDILTLCNRLMVENKYEPFLKTATYTKLYTGENSWRATIVANSANQKLEMERAMAFYKSKKK